MLSDQRDHQEHISSKKEDSEIPHWVGRWLSVMSHDQSSLSPYATNCSRHPARPEGRAGGESPLQTSEVLAACSYWLPGSGKDWCAAGGLLFPRRTSIQFAASTTAASTRRKRKNAIPNTKCRASRAEGQALGSADVTATELEIGLPGFSRISPIPRSVLDSPVIKLTE